MIKTKRENFNIEIEKGSIIEKITENDIPNLNFKMFSITSDITTESFIFKIYYLIKKDKANSKKMFFCSNYRATKEIDDDSLGFSCALSNNDSFIMLICFDYLDDKDNDTRNDFVELSNLKSPNLRIPILINRIILEAKKTNEIDSNRTLSSIS